MSGLPVGGAAGRNKAMGNLARLVLLVCLGLYWPASAVHGKVAEKNPLKPTPIREFDIKTLALLGREIYQHDQLAWVATDVLLAKVKPEDLKKDNAAGWIVDVSFPTKPMVRFLRSGKAGLEASYDVYFAPGEKPRLAVPEDRTLTLPQFGAAKAAATAQQELSSGRHPWCGGSPNLVVLEDPDGSGYLVYFLRAKPSATAVPVGGHYRMSVSADGSKIEQVDRLFASCLTLDSLDVPAGATPEVLVMSHVVSATPVETHVFLSLQEKLPFCVMAGEKAWYVDKGRIGLYDLKSGQATYADETSPVK